jgi:acetyltransferase-like isoleucine patch superfamily enzyme
MQIGNRATIGRNCKLICLTNSARIVIGNKCLLTNSVYLYSAKEIIIVDFVMLAGGVFIADTTHQKLSGDMPYGLQSFTEPKPVKVHWGAWVGQNVVIMPGCSIGCCSIVGANSVVTKSIPAHSIAIGSPAKVIKTWSTDKMQWICIDESIPSNH